MADILIRLRGSMGDDDVEFSSRLHGHAHAVNEAIAYLTKLQLLAINSDHEARDAEEEGPKLGWYKRDLEPHPRSKG